MPQSSVSCIRADLFATILSGTFAAAVLQREEKTNCAGALQRRLERQSCTFDSCSYLDMLTERAPACAVLSRNLQSEQNEKQGDDKLL